MIKCKNCGGKLIFDISSQKLICNYCNNKVNPYDFDIKNNHAEEKNDLENFEITMFTCSQCGGEILSTDDDAIGFCSYCGTSTILYSKIINQKRPAYIIPFRKTKQDCKQAYSSMMKRAIFAPKELRDEKFIDGFRGIYMPYWTFDISQEGPIALEGIKTYTSGDYYCKEYYSLIGDIDTYYHGLAYDASTSFSDDISASIAPFDVKGMRKFTPAYLSGFYANIANVSPDVYREDAELIAFQETSKILINYPDFNDYEVSPPEHFSLNTQTEEVNLALFPVWFLSYRNGNRIAYATINGQTGKIATDIPVDMKKYLFGSIVLMLPLFILLNLFLTVIPSLLIKIVAIITLFATIILTSETMKIAKKENFELNKGYLSKYNPEKLLSKKTIKQKKRISILQIVMFLFIIIILTLPIWGKKFFELVLAVISAPIDFVWIAVVLCGILIAVISIRKINNVPNKKGLLGLISAFVGIFGCAVVAFIRPVSDIHYYGMAIFTLFAVFLTIIGIIEQYNIISTRKLPQFDKEGGDNDA